MSIETFLNKLHKVRKRSHGQWMACCPVHQEKTPSLSIKDDNGTILIHCFGCGAGGIEVCGALGVDPADLFPPRDDISYDSDKPKRSYYNADHVLDGIQTESLVVYFIGNDVLQKKQIDQESWDRLKLAVERIYTASNYIRQK